MIGIPGSPEPGYGKSPARLKKRKGRKQSGLKIDRDFKVAFGTYLFTPVDGGTGYEYLIQPSIELGISP
jgi:hypothetical protein